MEFSPRWYQADAVKAVYEYLDKNPESNPCVVIPTGGGKTICIAMISADVAGRWGGRALVLSHVKELLEQSADKLRKTLDPGMVGVYSAGLNSRDTGHPVIVAGIQSVYRRAGEMGKFDAIIIDEVHLLNSANEDGMYRTFLDGARLVNPKVRIIGMTATPYRLDSGYICGPDNILQDIAYEVGIRELIVQGHLSPIRTRAGTERPDLSGLHVRAGEFVESEMSDRMETVVDAACREIAELTRDRQAVLVFAAGVKHGNHVRDTLRELTGGEIGFITGDTAHDERAGQIARFKGEQAGLFGGKLKYLVNVNVLTTGFDAPNIDAVVLLRATMSPGLFYQMVGRGFRTHPGKSDCIVLDYGENIVRHGPVDAIRIRDKEKGEGPAPVKECPQCHTMAYAGVAFCPHCAFEFPRNGEKHGERAGRAGVLSGEATTTEYPVTAVRYYVHRKHGDPDAPTTMRVEYECGFGRDAIKSEWLCFNHDNYARQKAEDWWRERSPLPPPETTEEAVRLASAGVLKVVNAITWRKVAGETFGRVIGWDMGSMPAMEEVDAALARLDKRERDDEWGDDFPEPRTGGGMAAESDWFEAATTRNDEIPF